jgi:hypothetical protein
MSIVGRDHPEWWMGRWLINWTALGKSMNGIPAPLAEDEDSDFGHESWYDRKDDKKGKAKDRPRRSGKRGEPRESGAKYLLDGDNDRIANFSLLDHDFPSDESDEEPFFDNDYSKPRSALAHVHSLKSLSRAETPAFILERRGRHKPLGSYFEDDVLDREGSVHQETGPHFRSPSHTQEGITPGGGVDAATGSHNVGIPPDPTANPDDESSVTGKPKFSHQPLHDVDIASVESETEADLEPPAELLAKRKYFGHSERPTKRQRLSVNGNDDGSVTESDDDDPCMYP